MGAIRHSCPIRLVPTDILPAKERRLLGKFQPDSFKTERCWSRIHILFGVYVANIWLKS